MNLSLSDFGSHPSPSTMTLGYLLPDRFPHMMHAFRLQLSSGSFIPVPNIPPVDDDSESGQLLGPVVGGLL